MDAAKLMEYLKAEFGIKDRAEFELAVSQMQGIDIGIFTIPFKGGVQNETKAAAEAARCG